MTDKTILSSSQRRQLEDALRVAADLTDCRVHLHLQAAANGYIFVSLVLASLATVFVTLASVVFGLAFWPMISLQILCFLGTTALFHMSGATHSLTPAFVKEALANYSLGKVLTAINASNSSGRLASGTSGDVLVMVSNFERFSKVIPSRAVSKQVPESVWQAINNSLMIDVGHGDAQKGLRNSTHAITKLLKVYFPKAAQALPVNSGEGLNAVIHQSVQTDLNHNRLVVVA